MTGSHGIDQYAARGSGGRQPVNWVGPGPREDEHLDPTLRPLVAVLDTGAGRHPWLGPDVVTREPEVLGQPLGIPSPGYRAERQGVADLMQGELDVDSGHATFIAGLVRQACPDARLLDVRLFGNRGVVAEADLLRSLQLLALRQLLALAGHPDHAPVDVVVMSLGYYHEQAEDAAFDALLRGPVGLLGRWGAAVVVSAGNDATQRPIYPAALAPYAGGAVPDDPAVVPVTAVGALNPDSSVALFSNDGPWVRFLRAGASLVSTMPTTYDASLQPTHAVHTARGEWRTAIDPDDFTSGFGVWSGTSFAAPVFAGQLAQELLERRVADRAAALGDRVGTLRALLAAMPGRREDLSLDEEADT